jgi:pSer/pThr/pTyr-binding forkhead associated (FHA) protein
MSQAHFELESEDRKRFPIPELPCTIGRSRDSDLGIDLDRISRRHARLEANGEDLLIIDLDSTNGTFVNHERIEQPNPVARGRLHPPGRSCLRAASPERRCRPARPGRGTCGR